MRFVVFYCVYSLTASITLVAYLYISNTTCWRSCQVQHLLAPGGKRIRGRKSNRRSSIRSVEESLGYREVREGGVLGIEEAGIEEAGAGSRELGGGSWSGSREAGGGSWAGR